MCCLLVTLNGLSQIDNHKAATGVCILVRGASLSWYFYFFKVDEERKCNGGNTYFAKFYLLIKPSGWQSNDVDLWAAAPEGRNNV